MELLVVRHAQPEKASGGSGPADPSLTTLGQRQAAAVADWISRDSTKLPGRIVTSPMRRAQETANVIARQTGVELEIDPRLAEFDRGATQYIPLELVGDDVLTSAANALTTGVWGDHTFDPDEFRERVWSGFDEITRDPNASRVVVVCHGGVLNSFLSRVVGRAHGVFFMPRYTSVSRVFAGERGELLLGSLNELPHAALDPELTF